MIETGVFQHGRPCCGHVKGHLAEHDTSVDELHVRLAQLKKTK